MVSVNEFAEALHGCEIYITEKLNYLEFEIID